MEKAVQLWVAVNGEGALDIHGNSILLESFSRDMDGIFPTNEDWKEFAESIDAEGVWFIGRKKLLGSAEQGVTYRDNYVTYRFKEPIKAVTGFRVVDGEISDVISDITSITFRFEYSWLWMKSDATIHEGASVLDIEGHYVSCG